MARGRNKARPNPDGTVAISDYRHAGVSRKNNPPASIAAEGWTPYIPQGRYSYSPRLPPELRFDETGAADQLPELLARARQGPLPDEEIRVLAEALRLHEPWLEWAGKREARGFALDPVALHIHERVSTQALLKVATRQDVTRDLFADPEQEYREAVQFYQHDVDWTNRLILGDSLQVMASLARREDLAGKVQMIYMDPPYGIKFASNFQTEIGKRDMKDKETDFTREPEMVKAYRDPWTLGIHSYLAYLPDRLVLCRELLTDSGSIFVQIGDENLHRVRMVMDEVFGQGNFIGEIVFATTTGLTDSLLASVADRLLWYAYDAQKIKYRQLYRDKVAGEAGAAAYTWVLSEDAQQIRRVSSFSKSETDALVGWRICTLDHIVSRGASEIGSAPIKAFGETFLPPPNTHWKTNAAGLTRLTMAGRVLPSGERSLRYVRYLEDFPAFPINNLWMDTTTGQFTDPKLFVVQTATKAIARCLLMTTDPGDLVLDPTCGSGTTAYVAEQWGRRWITIDTSRVAIAIARQRLLTARFDYYHLRDVSQGVTGGFRYKTVPHITLRSIAQNTHLDPIFAKHEPILDDRLAACNAALEKVDDSLRARLQSKLLLKQRSDGRKAITKADRRRWELPRKGGQWQHWQVPFDTDPDYPPDLGEAILAYRQAWRALCSVSQATWTITYT
jgi:adenine-specific DNA-methyltransferase